MLRRILVPFLFLSLFHVIIGCHSGSSSPLAPRINPPVSPEKTSSTLQCSNMLWGLWDVVVDIEAETINAVPMRGAMFNSNVVKFLQPPSSPINMLTFQINPESIFPEGYLDLDVTIRHPFVGNPKFRGFDVRGIVMGDGTVPFSWDTSALRSGPGDIQLLNADGYTRWWNQPEFTTYEKILGYTEGNFASGIYFSTATVNAYKYFSDSLDEETVIADLDLDSRGTFGIEPGINTRNYLLQFPVVPGGPVFHYKYAIDASWALPNEDFYPEYPVEAYPPEANMQEAWFVTVDDSESTAWYVNSTANGGELNLAIEVFDWQSAITESTVVDEVAAIWLESSLFASPTEIYSSTIPDPAGPVSSVWNIEIADLSLTSSGMFDLWIGVEASYPENYSPQIEGDPTLFDWPDVPLTAFFRGTVNIANTNPNSPPEVLEIIPPDGLVSTVETDVQIIGNNFMDGATVEFRYDVATTLDVSNVTWIDGNLITCDLDCAGPLGFYDVTVTNPDTQFGTLEDGFEVIEEWGCEGSAHDWGDEHDIGGLPGADFHKFDMAIMTQGSHEGMALYQTSYTSWGLIDPAGGDGQTIQSFLSTPQCYCVDIETCDISGRIAILPLNPDEVMWIYDAEGNKIGDFSDASLNGNFTAMDFDKNGDLWAISKTGGDPIDWVFEIRHYVEVDGEPWYGIIPEDTVNIMDTAMIGPAGSCHIGDIGISFYLHRLFIITANKSDGGSNKITSWDLNESPPVFVNELSNPYPPLTRHHIFSQGALSRMNIDVDHRFPNDKEEQCRLYAYATIWNNGLDCYVIRLDGDLNIMDEGSIFHLPSPNLAWDDIPQCCIINDSDPEAEANLFGCGWKDTDFCEWPTPVDW